MNSTRSAPTAQTDWADEVLRFWFTELSRQQWFASDATLDEQIRSRFREVYRMVAAALEDALLADDKTALAAVIVLDQFSRNMFRGTAGAFANDAKALAIAQKAIAKGFAGASAATSNCSSICRSNIRRMSMLKPEAWSSFLPWAILS
jgi:uncharacterized protein (DUF924 family)